MATALITGASNGIGLELAKVHASKGGDLVLVARNIAKLNELKAELEKQTLTSTTTTSISTTPQITPSFGQCGFSVSSPNARIVGGIQATV